MNTLQKTLFVLTVLLSIFIGHFAFDPQPCIIWVRDYGYWFMVLNFTLFCYFLYKNTKPWVIQNTQYFTKTFWLKKKTLLTLSLLLGCFIFMRVHEETQFKVVMDEPLMSSTAQGMHYVRQIIVPTRAHHIQEVFLIGGGFVDKRPPFYAFLVSLIHDISGYRTENAFILNFILTALFLLLAFRLGYELAGYMAGVMSVLLFTSIPLLIQTANGAGFELLNLCMILTAMLASKAYLKKPNSNTLGLLCLSAILLSNVRYESSLYILPIGLIIILGWYSSKKIMTSWAFVITPLLLIPYLWQHQTFKYSEHSWELESIKGASKPFGFQYFYDNLGHAVSFLFDLEKHSPNAPFLSAVGILSSVFFAVYLLKIYRLKQPLRVPTQVLAIFCIGFFIHLILLLTYFYGQLDTPIIQRLSLPIHLPFVYCTVWVLYGLNNPIWIRKGFLGAVLIFLIVYSLPITAQHTYSHRYHPARDVQWVLDYIDRNPKSRPDLVLTPYPWVWILKGIDAIGFPNDEEALKKLKFYLSGRQKKPIVYLHESFLFDMEKHEFRNRFMTPDVKIKASPFEEYTISELLLTRLSKVTDIEGVELIPPFPELKAGDVLDETSYIQYVVNNLP